MKGVRLVYLTLGKRIREERRRLEMTQGQLAERAGLSTNYIAHLEQGSRGASVDTLCRLAEIVETPVARLFDHVKLEPLAEPGRGEMRRLVNRLRRLDPPARDLMWKLADLIESWQRSAKSRRVSA